jgi:GT2 family glycosyltransferase
MAALADRSELVARVQDVELTAPLFDVPSADASGRRARTAWLLVRLDRTPVGVITMAVPPAGLDRGDVGEAIAANLGDAITRLASAHGATDPVRVNVDGLAPPWRAQSDRRRDEALRQGPELTVVVCTRDRPAALARCVDSLLAQPYPRFRILIVDNSAVPGAGSRCITPNDHAGRIEIVVAPRPGLSHARNVAVAATAGENLVWIDDDEVADEHWLCELAQAFVEHPEADVVAGAVVPAQLDTTAQAWFEQFGGLTKGRGFTPAVFGRETAPQQSPLYPLPPFGAGANLATRAGVIERIGGFDPALGAGSPAMGGEDTLALTQILLAGGTIVYWPAALTRHFHRPDEDGLRRQLIGYGTGLTAAYTSLILTDPRLLSPLLRLAPRAARDLLGGQGVRTATLADDFPRALLRANLRGMLAGPIAYMRGRRRARRWAS